MSILLLSLAKSPIFRYGMAVVAIIGVVFIYGQFRYSAGVTDTKAAYETKMQAERDRLSKINKVVREAAAEKEKSLREALGKLDDEIEQLREQAREDTDSDRPSLSPGSVSRIDGIR